MVPASAQASSLAASYQLQSLDQQEEEPFFRYTYERTQRPYTLTLQQSDRLHRACPASQGSMLYHLSLKLVNLFRVTLCLVPTDSPGLRGQPWGAAAATVTNQSGVRTYHVELLTRIAETRVMPPTADLRALERSWRTVLAAVQWVEVQDNGDLLWKIADDLREDAEGGSQAVFAEQTK